MKISIVIPTLNHYYREINLINQLLNLNFNLKIFINEKLNLNLKIKNTEIIKFNYNNLMFLECLDKNFIYMTSIYIKKDFKNLINDFLKSDYDLFLLEDHYLDLRTNMKKDLVNNIIMVKNIDFIKAVYYDYNRNYNLYKKLFREDILYEISISKISDKYKTFILKNDIAMEYFDYF